MYFSQVFLAVSNLLCTFAMSKRREKTKEPVVKLHRQLELQEQERKRITERKRLYTKVGDTLLDLGKLVFGGVLIGGLFEDFQHPYWLYSLGALTFIALMYYGMYLFKKGTKKE